MIFLTFNKDVQTEEKEQNVLIMIAKIVREFMEDKKYQELM